MNLSWEFPKLIIFFFIFSPVDTHWLMNKYSINSLMNKYSINSLMNKYSINSLLCATTASAWLLLATWLRKWVVLRLWGESGLGWTTGPHRFDPPKKQNCGIFVYVQFFCSINFCSGPFEIRQFKTNCSVLKIDWGSPHMVQLFTECVLCHYILLFYTHFCRLGLQTTDSGLISGT